MSFSRRKAGRLVPVLLTGVCVAACGVFAADGSPTNSGQKPAPQRSVSLAHPPAAHPAAPKPATTAPPHVAANRLVTHHPAPSYSTAKKSGTSPAAAVRRTPTHTVASSSAHQGAAARNKHPRYQSRALTSQQRLARLRPQPDRVEEIQAALIREGYLQGEPNGQWDSRTHDAMLRYQTDHGFPPTGLPEAKSLMKLGLGSHPLPAELDHGPAGVPSATATPGTLAAAPPASQLVPSVTPSTE